MTENLMTDAEALGGTDVDRRPRADRGGPAWPGQPVWPARAAQPRTRHSGTVHGAAYRQRLVGTVAAPECGGEVRVAWMNCTRPR